MPTRRLGALLIGPLAILALATARNASAQETAPPAAPAVAPAARDVAADVERLLEAQRAKSQLVAMNALQKEWPPAVLLDGCVALLRDRSGEVTAAFRSDVVRWLVSARCESSGRTVDQDRALADVLAPCLADPWLCRNGIVVVPVLAAEARQPLVPLVIAALEYPDWTLVADVCRMLARLGPDARDALPRLRDVLVQPEVLPAATAPPPTEPTPFREGDTQDRFRGISRFEAATARMWITRDTAIDAPLYAELDPDGQKQLWLAAAMVAARSRGGFDGNEAHARELSALLLDRLERSGLSVSKDDELAWPVLALLAGDGMAEPARSRARALVQKLETSADAAVAECAGKLVHRPETICQVDQPPPADPRQTLLFAPQSSLSGAVALPGGVVALSSSMRVNVFEQYANPPSAVLTVHVWDAAGRETQRFDGIAMADAVVTLSRSGARLFVGPLPDPEGHASIVDLELATGTQRHVPLAGPAPRLRATTFLDEALVATATEDRGIEVWDLETCREVAHLDLDGVWISCLAASTDGRLLLAGCGDGRLILLAFQDGALRQERVVLEPVPDPERAVRARELMPKAPDYPLPTALAILPDGTAALCADNFGDVVLRNLADGAVLRTLPPTHSSTQSLCISRDGVLALAGSRGLWSYGKPSDPSDFTVRLLDLRSGTELTRFTGMQSSVGHVAFIEDEAGVKGALGLSDFALRVWTVEPPAGR